MAVKPFDLSAFTQTQRDQWSAVAKAIGSAGHAPQRPAPSQEVRDRLRAAGQARDAELKAQGRGPSEFNKLNATLDKQLQKAINAAVAKKAPKHSTLIADLPSTCLELLTWKTALPRQRFIAADRLSMTLKCQKASFWIGSIAAHSENTGMHTCLNDGGYHGNRSNRIKNADVRK